MATKCKFSFTDRAAYAGKLFARMFWIPLPQPPEAESVHRHHDGYTVTMRRSEIDFGECVIDYIPKDSEKVVLWKPIKSENVFVTVVKAASGTGKSTLLTQLYRAIRERLSSPLGFDFDPDLILPEDVAIAFLPQKAPIVRHWKVKHMIPRESTFLQGLLPQEEDSERLFKRLSQFSGGQHMRLYASSALEQLSTSTAHAAFLLLDETFDGIGGEEDVAQAIETIRNVWCKEVPQKSLHVMLVSHKQLGEGRLSIPNSVSLVMDVTSRKKNRIEVQMENQ